jgi:hypothetical protein
MKMKAKEREDSGFWGMSSQDRAACWEFTSSDVVVEPYKNLRLVRSRSWCLSTLCAHTNIQKHNWCVGSVCAQTC